MTLTNHRAFFSIGSIILLATVTLAAYFAQPFWFLAPLFLIAIFFLLQYPALLFYFLLLSIPWSTEFNFSPELGTDLPDEPLMLLAALASIVSLIFHRKKLWKEKPHPLLVIIMLQVIWLLFAVALSSHIPFSVKYFLAKAWYLLAFIAAPLLLWKDEKVLKRSVLILFASMLAATTVALFRHALQGFTFHSVNDALKPFFRNHVNYSALLVFMIPLQILFWQQAKTKTLRFAIACSFLITLPALYFSFARGAWLALVMGSISYVLIQKKWLFNGFVFAIIFVTGLFFWLKHNDRYLQFAHDYQSTIFHKNFGDHLAATYQLKDLSTAERFHRWIAGVRMIDHNWQKGFGPATFYQHYKGYTVPAFKTWVSKNEERSTVHNYFLLLAVEQGIPGLPLFVLLIGSGFWYAQKIYHRTDNLFWRRVAATIAAILVMQCTLNFLSDLIETDKVGSVFSLCFAVLIIADIKTQQRQTKN